MSERFTRKESTYYERAICRLQELENKLESGELIEFPRITETVKGLEWAVEYVYTSYHGSGIAKIFCGTKSQAEEKLKELQEGKQ